MTDITNEANNGREAGRPSTGRKVADAVSHLLSWVMVPMLMPVYSIMLIFGLTLLDYLPLSSKIWTTVIIFVINVLLPMVLFLLLRIFGLLSDPGINNRKERYIPYAITIVAYLSTAFYLWSKGAPQLVWLFYCGGAVAAAINLLVNFGWKISAHAAAAAGVVALLVRLMTLPASSPATLGWLIAFIASGGALGSARVWLGRHTVWQVMAGYAVGFFSVYLITMIE